MRLMIVVVLFQTAQGYFKEILPVIGSHAWYSISLIYEYLIFSDRGFGQQGD